MMGSPSRTMLQWDTAFSLSQLINYIQSTSIELCGETFFFFFADLLKILLSVFSICCVCQRWQLWTDLHSKHLKLFLSPKTTDNIRKLPQTSRFLRIDKFVQHAVVSLPSLIVMFFCGTQRLSVINNSLCLVFFHLKKTLLSTCF